MGWLRENLHWVLFVAFLFTTAVTVGVGLVAVLASLSALLAGGPLLSAVAGSLEALALYVIPLALLGVLDVVLLASAVWIGIRRFSFRSLVPSIDYRSDRLARWAGDLEAQLPFLRPLGLSAKLEPTPEQRRERLKELYVEGEIGVEAFEREMAKLVDGEPSAPDVIEDTEIPVSDGPGSASTAGSGGGSAREREAEDRTGERRDREDEDARRRDREREGDEGDLEVE